MLSWIKISTDIFNNRKIKYIRSLKDGNDIALIWIMLLTLAGKCNDNGFIYITSEVPYTAGALSRELDFKEAAITSALDCFERLSMIERKNNFIRLLGWEEYQSVEKLDSLREYNRLAQQRSRAKRKNVIDMSMTETANVNDCHGIEEEGEEDKEKEYSIFLSCEKSGEKTAAERTYLGGSLGQGLVFISQEQIDDLLDKLSVEEFDHYVEVIADCEKRGKHFGKTHYQAILDMADKDRRKRKPV